jgi:uncharacterized protein (TIGR00297 family)
MGQPKPQRESFQASADTSKGKERLHWQSRAVLVLMLPTAAVYALLLVIDVPSLHLLYAGAGVSLGLAALVLAAKSATVPAAATGALLALCYALTPTFPHSPLWLLLAMLGMTLGASKVGKRRKREIADTLGPREILREDRGALRRNAAQVAANLGVGALAGALGNQHGALVANTVLLAALAEATADTLSSEVGQLAARPPRMLLTGRVASPGTDGAISLPGTAAGVAGAILLGLLGCWAFALPEWAGAVGVGAGVFGLFFDSVLGQLAELRGYVNNDAVNFLSTLAAAGLALILMEISHGVQVH